MIDASKLGEKVKIESNHRDIARNISAPRLMRDRVVRKERCEPLG